MLSLANLGWSYRAYDQASVFNIRLGCQEGQRLISLSVWGLGSVLLALLSPQLLSCPCRHPCRNPCHPYSLGSGQGYREAKELPKSCKFIKKRFTSGQETAVILLPWRRVSFTAAACLLCHQHTNISHEYSGRAMKCLFLKIVIISKPINCVQTLFSQRKDRENTSLCSRSAWFLKVGWSCIGSLSQVWRIKHVEIVPLI